MITEKDLEKLKCVLCGESLKFVGEKNLDFLKEGRLICQNPEHIFTVSNSIPVLLIPDRELKEKYANWKSKQLLLPRIRTQILMSEKQSDYAIQLDYQSILDFSNFVPGKDILEIGCGNCILGKYLNGFMNYWGIDPISKDSNCNNYRFVNAIGEALPFKASTFDYIILKDSIDYFYDLKKLFINIKSLLKNNSHLIITNIGRYGNNKLYRKMSNYKKTCKAFSR